MAAEFAVVFALYPEVTQLDFTGPLEVFARLPQARVILASVRGAELTAGALTFARLHPLAEVSECALLCVPGGSGCSAAMAVPIAFVPISASAQCPPSSRCIIRATSMVRGSPAVSIMTPDGSVSMITELASARRTRACSKAG